MKKQLIDKKYIKFENLIIKTYISLLGTKDDIQISDILKKAKISRATLYAHFKSQDDIFTGVEKYLAEKYMNWYYKDLKYTVNHLNEWFDTVFKYIDENNKFFTKLAQTTHIGGIIKHIGDKFYESMFHSKRLPKNVLHTELHDSPIPIYGMASSIVGAIFGKLINKHSDWKVVNEYCSYVLYTQSRDIWKQLGILEGDKVYWR